MPGRYDDWELEVRHWESGQFEMIVRIPHNEPAEIVLPVAPEEVLCIGNILDAGLQALGKTTERKEVTDGRDPTTIT